MEGFSAAQIAHYQAVGLDHYVRGPLFNSGIQEKPTLMGFEKATKTFPGGNENISLGVKFETGAGGTNDGVTGFSHTDTVGFYNPGKGKRANYVWREHHIGMTLSETELKRHGILVDDKFDKKVRRKGDRGLHILSNLMDEALADFSEQYASTMNSLIWGDGTADSSALHGLRSFILDIPTLGTVGGLSNVTYPKWRNRAYTAAFAADGSFDATYGGNKVTSSTSNGGALVQVLQEEWRQLRRYGGKPNHFVAGSEFIAAMETEMRANGYYSDSGFTGRQDASMGEMYFKGIPVIYDPTLDDLSRSKYAYIWDDRDIYLYALEGDWKRQRTPARPYDQFVFHQSLLCTGQMVARRRNSSLVIEIA
ncbi:phage major capsid protein [uncultured Maritimibacter sp.]|uniref:phage major capsid protein n=1 Tax=uncultured Maritimibacter sp. TaxID=991866 RepID=UPI002596026D|nr:phage major capsid protein [uncultured Maritimibacter sp.]